MKPKMSMSDAGKLGYIKSQAIHQENKRQRVEAYLLNPVRCKQCLEIIPYENIVKRKKNERKFCSRSCNISFQNTGICRNGLKDNPTNPNRKKKPCKQCGKPTVYNTCSLSCKQEFAKQEFLAGRLKFSSARIKKYLIDKHGNRCMMESCGWDWYKPCGLELDHIDGNSENDNLDNLRLICPNCHSLTPTYKARNKGRGRFYRRVRYEQGKSF